MVVGPQPSQAMDRRHQRLESGVLSGFSDQSKVLRVVMNALANMLNDTSVASIGNDTVFRDIGAKGNASALLPDVLDLLKEPEDGSFMGLSGSTLRALVVSFFLFS